MSFFFFSASLPYLSTRGYARHTAAPLVPRTLVAVDWLDAQEWQSRPLADFSMVSGPLHARVSVEGYESVPYGLELTLMKRWLRVDTWCTEMASVLEKHDRPARRRRPSESEFLAIFGLWLIQQLEHERTHSNTSAFSSASSAVSMNLASKLDAARTRLEYAMSADRRHTLLAALGLPIPAVRRLVDQYRAWEANFMQLGKILTIDATILTSESKLEAKHGTLPFLRSLGRSPTPHIADCIFQRMLLTKSPVIVNFHLVEDPSNSDIVDAASNLIMQMEKEFNASFLVFLDSNFPASHFLYPPASAFNSKFVCCITQNSDAGPLRYLVDSGVLSGIKPPQKVLLHSPKLRLTAYIPSSNRSRIAIVTNAFLPEANEEMPPQHPFPISERAARSLASWDAADFSVLMTYIDPTYLNDTERLHDRRKSIFQLTGVDVASPVDASGFVTASTLAALTMPQLQDTAHMIKADTSRFGQSLRKEELIREILEKHPRARHTPILHPDPRLTAPQGPPHMQQMPQRLPTNQQQLANPPMAAQNQPHMANTQSPMAQPPQHLQNAPSQLPHQQPLMASSTTSFDPTASIYGSEVNFYASPDSGVVNTVHGGSYRDPERRLREITDRLMEPGTEPDFYELYTTNFGLDDRLENLHYERFQHTYSKAETSKFTWLLFYTSIVNIFAFSQEIRAEAQLRREGIVKPEELPSVTDFCLTLAEQIGQVYGSDTPHHGEN